LVFPWDTGRGSGRTRATTWSGTARDGATGRLFDDGPPSERSKPADSLASLEDLSKRLTGEFGKGYDPSNLRNMWSFFMTYPIRDAVRHELSWTHFRVLLRKGLAA
jgi:hypothetical protein